MSNPKQVKTKAIKKTKTKVAEISSPVFKFFVNQKQNVSVSEWARQVIMDTWCQPDADGVRADPKDIWPLDYEPHDSDALMRSLTYVIWQLSSGQGEQDPELLYKTTSLFSDRMVRFFAAVEEQTKRLTELTSSSLRMSQGLAEAARLTVPQGMDVTQFASFGLGALEALKQNLSMPLDSVRRDLKKDLDISMSGGTPVKKEDSKKPAQTTTDNMQERTYHWYYENEGQHGIVWKTAKELMTSDPTLAKSSTLEKIEKVFDGQWRALRFTFKVEQRKPMFASKAKDFLNKQQLPCQIYTNLESCLGSALSSKPVKQFYKISAEKLLWDQSDLA